MANEIYNSSWWGFPSATGWGNIYYRFANSIAQLITNFTNRVTGSGGVVEATEFIEQDNDASFMLQPSGYNNGILHAIIPEDGSGDLNFSRIGDGTRINAQGIIETPSVGGDELITNGSFETIIGDELVTNGAFDVLLGNEVVVNGDFEDGLNGWINHSGDATASNGEVHLSVDLIRQDNVLVSGKEYRVEVNVTEAISGTGKIQLGNTVLALSGQAELQVFTATATGSTLYFGRVGGGDNFKADNISIKEVTEGYIDETELVTNGGFEDGLNGWTNSFSTLSVVDGKAKVVGNLATNNKIKCNSFTPVIGETYKIEFDIDVDNIVDNTLGRITVGGFGTPFDIPTGRYSTTFTATTTAQLEIFFRDDSNIGTSFITVDNISVKEVVQDNWELQNGWSIQNESAVFSGSASAYRKLFQEDVLTIGKKYKLTFNILSIDSGSINNFSQSNPISYDTLGEKTEYFTATFDDLFLEATTDAELEIDNISVKEVTEGYIGDELVDNGDFEDGEIGSENLLPYSEDFSRWAVYNIDNLTANQGVSPNGNNDATKIAITTNKAKSTVYKTSTIIGNTTRSVFAKKGSADFIFFDVPNSSAGAWFNLSNGQLGTINSGTATIEDYGNGWYRCSCTANWTTATFAIGLSDEDNSTAISGGKDILIWGAQVENLPYATSYIKTEGSSASRANTTDWTLGNGWSIQDDGDDNKALKGNPSLNNAQYATYDTQLIAGKTYILKYSVLSSNNGNYNIWYGGDSASRIGWKDQVGDFELEVTPVTTGYLRVQGGGAGFDGEIDNISVKELAINNWSPGTGWVIGDNVATNTGSGININQRVGNFSGKTVLVEFDIIGMPSGSNIRAELGGSFGALKTDNGRYSSEISPSSAGAFLYLYGSPFEGSIDNVTVKEIIEDSVPRLNYDSIEYANVLGSELITNGEFDGEIGSTNWLEDSEDFSTNKWTRTGVTVSTNQVEAPDGTLTADLITRTSSNWASYVRSKSFDVSAGDYTMSIHLKYYDIQYLNILPGNSGNSLFTIDLLNKEIVNDVDSNLLSFDILEDGWMRVALKVPSVSTTYLPLYMTLNSGTGGFTSASDLGGCYMWGAQLEDKSYATSYIPTLNGVPESRVDDTDWDSIPTGWKIENGVATSSGVNDAVAGWLRQNFVLTIGKKYELTIQVETDDTGKVGQVNDGHLNYIDMENGSGEYTATFVAKGHYLALTQKVGKTYTVDNVSVKEVLGQEVASSGKPSLLLEPESTNLVTYSEDFVGNGWILSNVTVAPVTNIVNPFGDSNCALVTATGANPRLRRFSFPSGNITYSIFVKKNTSNYFKMRLYDGTTDHDAEFDLDEGTHSSGSTVTSDMKFYGNGWYRCVASINAAAGATLQQYVSETDTGSVYVWGAQLEALTYATAYIATDGAPESRLEEFAQNLDVEHLIGQSEGSFILDISDAEDDVEVFSLGRSSITGSFIVYKALGMWKGLAYSTTATTYNKSLNVTGKSAKIGMSYKDGELIIAINGSIEYSTTNFDWNRTTPLDRIYLNPRGYVIGPRGRCSVRGLKLNTHTLTAQELIEKTAV